MCAKQASMLALLLACSGGDDAATPSVADPCCVAAAAGVEVWEQCQDATVLKVTCQQASQSCCSVAWTEDCASFYEEFSPTCTAEVDPARNDAASRGSKAITFSGERTKVKLTVKVEPAPTQAGGNIFYAGFAELDPKSGGPPRGETPNDYGLLVHWASTFPATEEVELVPGLHYFAMYGMGDHPSPGDRMGSLVQLTEGATELTLTVSGVTIPTDEDGAPPP